MDAPKRAISWFYHARLRQKEATLAASAGSVVHRAWKCEGSEWGGVA
jgi:hypothetical protein